eukprot:UC4_evm10s1044
MYNQTLCSNDEEQFLFHFGGVVSGIFIILLLYAYFASLPGPCCLTNRLEYSDPWTSAHILFLFWWSGLLTVLQFVPDVCSNGEMVGMKLLCIAGIVTSGFALFHCVILPKTYRPFGLPIPYDASLRLTYLIACFSAAIITNLSLNVKTVKDHPHMAIFWAIVVTVHFFCFLYPNNKLNHQLKKQDIQDSLIFDGGIPKPHVLLKVFSGIKNWQFAVIINLALNISIMIAQKKTNFLAVLVCMTVPLLYAKSLPFCNEIRDYLARQVEFHKFINSKFYRKVQSTGWRWACIVPQDFRLKNRDAYREADAKILVPGADGIIAMLPLQCFEALGLVIAGTILFIFAVSDLVDTWDDPDGLGYLAISVLFFGILMFWYFWIHVLAVKALAPTMPQKLAQDERINKFRKSREPQQNDSTSAFYRLLKRYLKFVGTWYYQQAMQGCVFMSTFATTWKVYATLSICGIGSITTNIFCFVIIGISIFGIFLCALTLAGGWLSSDPSGRFHSWGSCLNKMRLFLTILAQDESRRITTIVRSITLQFKTLLTIILVILTESCNSVCPEVAEIVSVCQFSWSIGLILGFMTTITDLSPYLKYPQFILLPFPRIFAISGTMFQFWLLIMDIALVAGAKQNNEPLFECKDCQESFKRVQCQTGVTISLFLPALLMGGLVFYGMYLANEIRRYLDYISLLILESKAVEGTLMGTHIEELKAPDNDISLELGMIASTTGVQSIIPYMLTYTVSFVLVATALPSIINITAAKLTANSLALSFFFAPPSYMFSIWIMVALLAVLQLSITPNYIPDFKEYREEFIKFRTKKNAMIAILTGVGETARDSSGVLRKGSLGGHVAAFGWFNSRAIPVFLALCLDSCNFSVNTVCYLMAYQPFRLDNTHCQGFQRAKCKLHDF